MSFVRPALATFDLIRSLFQNRHASRINRSSFPTRLRFECLEDRRMLTVLSIGTGDSSVQVDVDGYGSFGREITDGTAMGDAKIDQIGPDGQIGLLWQSATIIRANSSEVQPLSDGFIGLEGNLDAVNVNLSQDNSTATSSFVLSHFNGFFSLDGLVGDLVQQLSPLTQGGTQVGAILKQTYTFTNPTLNAMSFALFLSFSLSPVATQHTQADTFGSGVNLFEIEFVTIGDPGKPSDYCEWPLSSRVRLSPEESGMAQEGKKPLCGLRLVGKRKSYDYDRIEKQSKDFNQERNRRF